MRSCGGRPKAARRRWRPTPEIAALTSYGPSTGPATFIPGHHGPGMIVSVVLALRNETAAVQTFCSSIICNGAAKNWNPSPCLATWPIPGQGKW